MSLTLLFAQNGYLMTVQPEATPGFQVYPGAAPQTPDEEDEDYQEEDPSAVFSRQMAAMQQAMQAQARPAAENSVFATSQAAVKGVMEAAEKLKDEGSPAGNYGMLGAGASLNGASERWVITRFGSGYSLSRVFMRQETVDEVPAYDAGPLPAALVNQIMKIATQRGFITEEIYAFASVTELRTWVMNNIVH